MKELAIKSVLFLVLLASVSFADLIGPTAEMTLIFIVLIFAANFAINFVLSKALLYSFKDSRKEAKFNEMVRILGITIIGFVGDFIMLVISGSLVTVVIGVFVIASIASYFLLFQKSIDRRHAIISSAIFGIISNPAWLLMFL